ncbi:MAG: hypothetical protein ACKOPS_21825, partial [Cyanobium sp.]
MALAPGVLESLLGLDSDWLLIPIDGRKRPVDPATGEPLGQWASAGLSLEDFTAAAGNQNINQIPSAVHQLTRKSSDRGPCNVWSVHKLRGSQQREFSYR